MLHEWARCHDEAANPQLPTAVAIFVILHLSTHKEHGGSYSLLMFGLERRIHDKQHLPNQKNTVNMILILLQLYHAFFRCGESGIFH